MNNTVITQRISLCGLLIALGILASNPVIAEGRHKYWRCDDPRDPLRFVKCANDETPPAQRTCRDKKTKVDPPCAENGWLLLEPRMIALIEQFEGKTFVHANAFLAEAAGRLEVPYPSTSEGYPITTTALYRDPERYGFQTVALRDAPTGAFVLYRGLGGVVLNSCEEESDVCQPSILYPSRVRNYRVTLSDPFIPGESQPLALIHPAAFEFFLHEDPELDLEMEEATDEGPPG